jgi:hypothetical protein
MSLYKQFLLLKMLLIKRIHYDRFTIYYVFIFYHVSSSVALHYARLLIRA